MERRQDRLTFEDTIKAQKELLPFVRDKKKTGNPLSPEEKETFPEKLAYALMSQGQAKVFYEYNTLRIPLGTVHTLGLKMLDVKDKQVVISYNQGKYTLETKKLWELLYINFMTVFPRALEEAIHMSKEVPHREKAEGYSFSSDRSLE